MSEIKHIDDDRFEMCYINTDKTFIGDVLVDDDFAIHARKRIDGILRWKEVVVDKEELIPYYLDVLEQDFKQYE